MGKSSFTRVVDKNKDKRGESKLTAWEKRKADDGPLPQSICKDGSPGELTRPHPNPPTTWCEKSQWGWTWELETKCEMVLLC